jgi:hypothetical protein
MKRRLILSVFIPLYIFGVTSGQQPGDSLRAPLANLFKEIHSSSEDSIRLSANDSIRLLVGKFAAREELFNRRYQELKYLGQIISPDSSLKIITWNIALKNNKGFYYCYFVRKNTNGTSLNVSSLVRPYEPGKIRTDTIFLSSDWYGALYYGINPFEYEGRKCWILLGVNYSDPLVTRKIIDVLSFRNDGSMLLGMKWFDTGKAIRYRHVLEYSSSAVITLRFLPDSLIVFDHLVPVPGSGGENQPVYGPDYSYDSFTFDNGFWRFSGNFDARNPQK